MARNKNGAVASKSAKRGRKSKAESMTGAAASRVETRSAGELDLQQAIVDDGDFDLHFRAAKNAKDRMKTAKNLYDGCCKAAKKVSVELLAAVKLALKMEDQDDEDIRAALRVMGYVLKKTNQPVQISLHDILAGDVNDAAYKRGKDDALNGKGCHCPYPDGSDLADNYNTGWRNGIGVNLGLTQAQMAADAGNGGVGHNSGESPSHLA